MDHLDFSILFISFSSWVAALITSLFIRHGNLKTVAVEFRKFSIPLALFILLQLLFYYLENAFSVDYPEWVSIIYWNLVQLLFALCTYYSVPLSCSMTNQIKSAKTVRFRVILWGGLLFLVLLLLQLADHYSLNSLILAIPVSLFFICGFGESAFIQFKNFASQKDKISTFVYGIINLLVIFVFIEDFIISCFENIILNPYIFLLINIFFIRLFGKELHKGISVDNNNTNIESAIAQYEISPREADVLMLLIKGNDRNEIGKELYISPHTVKTHISNIYKKMDISSRQELSEIISSLNDL